MSSKSWKPSKNKDKREETTGASQDSDLAGSSRLPFEPQSSKKALRGGAQASKSKLDIPSKGVSLEKTEQVKKQANQNIASVPNRSAAVPEAVSKRMVRRILFFSGIPSSLGMLTFIISYIVVSQHYFKLPPVVVFLISLGFFGLGVLGLSYGALSASWDEDRIGNWFGWSEFKTNFGRMIASWREARQKES
ncbi:PAM68 family protein [Phormidium sp. CLA17]|uniref:PAM68 family protein n=1 Tax=Leptolyngbya sp. Cla-17 TaxID=2803751 RepID=UPI0014922D14|nr:PAM68 family protein [Leptolyngbya sp. Cla-17]MBM0740712.1 PAM68 family protein [Leptolyngbya sp. Cla-17]